MNAAALLALIADLYEQVAALRSENERLVSIINDVKSKDHTNNN